LDLFGWREADDGYGRLCFVPFTAAQVKQMESDGSQVLGYFSLGEAETFRDYFSSLPKSVVGPQDPDWPGDYQVAFWTPQWKAVAEQAIDQMVAAGTGTDPITGKAGCGVRKD
jgi:uncharacterized protein (TIGR01370 family)